MSLETVRAELGVQGGGNEKKLAEWYDFTGKGWFSSKVSTEAMKRGTSNESAVAIAISRMDCIEALFDVLMLSMKEERYIACSLDAVVILEIRMFP